VKPNLRTLIHQFSKYLFRLLFSLPSSGWYKGLNYKLQSPLWSNPIQFSKYMFRQIVLLHSSGWYKGLNYGSKIHVSANAFSITIF